MIDRPIYEIDFECLQRLIDHRVPEGMQVEYKRDFPAKKKISAGTNERDSFLDTISAFANTNGGDLLIGVEEKKGLPVGFPGIEINDTDKMKLSIDGKISYGLEPRLASGQNYSIHMVSVPEHPNHYVLIIRVTPSWRRPHQVVGRRYFFRRSSNSNQPLNVDEIRAAFLMSETIVERIRKFRFDRIASIYSHETPVPLCSGPRMVFHLIPLNALTAPQPINIASCRRSDSTPMPPGGGNGGKRVNLDGVYTYSRVDSQMFSGYAQIFRSGIVEGVEVIQVMSPEKIIPRMRYERQIIDFLKDYYEFSVAFNIAPPYFAFLSFVGVAGYMLSVGSHEDVADRVTLRDDLLNITEVEIRDREEEPEKVLRPIFDMVWNAFGYDCSGNYDNQGKWRTD